MPAADPAAPRSSDGALGSPMPGGGRGTSMRRSLVATIVGSILVGAAAWTLLRRSESAAVRAPAASSETELRLVEIWRSIVAANRAASAERIAILDSARRELLPLETNHADEAGVHFARGVIEVLAHKEADAQAAYMRLVAATPSGVTHRMSVYLRSIHVLEFDPKHAAEAVRLLPALQARAPDFMPEPVRRALFRALVLDHESKIEAERYDEAVDLIGRAVDAAGADVALALEARRARALALALADRWAESEAAWRQLIIDDPDSATGSRFRLAAALAFQNKTADAEAAYSAVIDAVPRGVVGPGSAEEQLIARFRRGNCRRILGRFGEAKADIEAYLAAHPADYRAKYWLAVVLIDGFAKPEAAEPLLIAAHEVAPWCETYLRLLVSLYEDLRPDPEKAAVLRKELETGREARTARREELVKQGFLEGRVCD